MESGIISLMKKAVALAYLKGGGHRRIYSEFIV